MFNFANGICNQNQAVVNIKLQIFYANAGSLPPSTNWNFSRLYTLCEIVHLLLKFKFLDF